MEIVERATQELRWVESFNDNEIAFVGENRWGVRVRYKLQQKWEIEEGGKTRYEWRDVEKEYD